MVELSDTWVVVARILRPQGRKGEVLAELLTDFPESLSAGRELFLASPTATTPPQPVQITGQWLPHGRNQGRIALALAGIDSIPAAERLAEYDLVVRRGARLPLSGGEVYTSDLVGLQLFSRGVAIGRVEDVSFPSTADGKRRLENAAPLLVVTPHGGGEVLVPFVEAFLLRIDLEAKIIEMTLPEGLLDLNSDAEI